MKTLLQYLRESNDTGPKKGEDHFVTNIEQDSIENKDFRRVLYTTKDMQIVVMSISPGEDVGLEIHKNIDQFFRVEEGEGRVIFNGKEFLVKKGFAFVVPQGTKHNIVNTSLTKDLKIYTVYAPPRHKKDTVHVTRDDAMKDEKDQFDGKTDV